MRIDFIDNPVFVVIPVSKTIPEWKYVIKKYIIMQTINDAVPIFRYFAIPFSLSTNE